MTEQRQPEFGGTEGVEELHSEGALRQTAAGVVREEAGVPEGTDSRQAGEGHAAEVDTTGSVSAREAAGSWHAEAGRKGALRIRELIREGRLYEQEHGWTRGRQRIRQLIAEGKLYEQEHGLRPTSRGADRSRPPRMSKQQVLRSLFHALVGLAKPGLRTELVRLVQELEGK